MLRTWSTPRWLGLTAILLAVLVGFGWLGLWQLGVAERGKQADVGSGPNLPRTPITRVMAPHDSFPRDGSLRRVSATGHYDPARQTLVGGRLLNGKPGYWVVTGFVVDGQRARLPVVRGFVAEPGQARRAPGGTTTVEGALAPGESPSATDTPPGRLDTVDLPRLMGQWDTDVYNSFVFLTAEHPTRTTAPVQSFPPPRPASGGLQLRNLGYALQWWIFAAFAVYMFVRQLRDESQRPAPGSGAPASGGAPAAADGGVHAVDPDGAHPDGADQARPADRDTGQWVS